MRVKLKRVFSFFSAVVIGGVSCVTTWFSVPASAAAGVGWLEWMEFQALLQGIGIGGNNSDFSDSVQNWVNGIGGAEMPRDDYDGEWMTNYEYYNRLGWDEIIDWFDDTFSGDDLSYSDVADVGTDVSGSGNGFLISPDGSSINYDYIALHGLASSTSPVLGSNGAYGWFDPFVADRYVSSDQFSKCHKYIVYCSNVLYFLFIGVDSTLRYDWTTVKSNFWIHFSFSGAGTSSGYAFPGKYKFSDSVRYSKIEGDNYISDVIDVLSAMGIDIKLSDMSLSDYIDNIDYDNYIVSDGFIGPVYTYPAAQDLYKSTGTAAGVRLDVQTQDGVPDLQAALDGAGVDTVDDLVAGVAAGTVPMSKVLSDAKVTPYVVADTTAGTVVTDLGVSATATGVKAVGLTQDLAVPKDLTNAATYVVKGKTWDPEMSKYKLPLFQYFPFCLPWDIYQVLAAFSADPVAPVFDIPVGKILSGVRSADVSKAASLSAKIDFGDDNWSKVFEVIRILECAGIIVGLCLVAVNLIHGGR